MAICATTPNTLMQAILRGKNGMTGTAQECSEVADGKAGMPVNC